MFSLPKIQNYNWKEAFIKQKLWKRANVNPITEKMKYAEIKKHSIFRCYQYRLCKLSWNCMIECNLCINLRFTMIQAWNKFQNYLMAVKWSSKKLTRERMSTFLRCTSFLHRFIVELLKKLYGLIAT